MFNPRTSSSQSISLLNNLNNINVLTLIPRYFKLSTNNSSGLFNPIILSNTSNIISEFIKENPDKLEYHIDIQDDNNVIGKLEEIYSGSSIKFNQDDFIVLIKVTERLELLGLLNIFSQSKFLLQHRIGKIIFLKNDNSSIKIGFSSLSNFIQLESNNTFTIHTKQNEYKCNIFGILFSSIIREYLLKDPTNDHYNYDFDDEEGEFQDICKLFNFQFVELTKNNADVIKEAVNDLKISNIFNKIDQFIEDKEKVSQAIDDHQGIIDTIDELFELLYSTKEKTVKTVFTQIKDSTWAKDEKSVFDLASFILQVVESDVSLHQYMIELISLMNEEIDKNELKKLYPYLVDHLLNIFPSDVRGNHKNIISFIYQLYTSGLLCKEKVDSKLKGSPNIDQYCVSWFLPEIIEGNTDNLNIDFKRGTVISDTMKLNFISNGSTSINEYRRLRDKGELNDEISKAIRNDDVDTFQSIISKNVEILIKNTIDPNIFEDFVGFKTRYLNYAASHGSIKCFKYMLLNNEKIDESTFKMAVIGGNIELIRIVDNEKTNFLKSKKSNRYSSKRYTRNSYVDAAYEAIKRHRNDIFDWILEQKFNEINQGDNLEYLVKCSIENGNPHSLVQLIDNGFNFHDCSNNYSQFLQTSCEKGFYLFTIFLIKLINKNNSNRKVSVNLSSTVYFGNVYIFNLFVTQNTKKEITSVLIYSIKKDINNIIQFFIEKVVDRNFNLDSENYLEILTYSIQNKKKEITDYLIEKLEISKTFNVRLLFSLLKEVQTNENIELMKYISELIYQNNSNNDFTDIIKKSIELKQNDLIKYYINEKYIIDYDALIDKIVSEALLIDVENFCSIFENANSMNKKRMFDLIDEAIKSQNKPLVKYLLEKSPPNEHSLIQAIKTNDLEFVEIVLDKNSEPSFVNKLINNETALITAVEIDNLSILNRLLSIPGIDPNVYNKKCVTPLIYSIIRNKPKMFDSIFEFYGEKIKDEKDQLEKGIKFIIGYLSSKIRVNDKQYLLKIIELKCINPNIRTNNNTLLNFACRFNLIEIVKILLEQYENIDVNLNIPDNGDTALITSIRFGYNAIFELLVNHPKININQRNYDGYSPLIISIKSLNDNNSHSYSSKSRLKEKFIIPMSLIKSDKFDPVESNVNLAFYLFVTDISKLLLSTFDSVDVNYVPFQAKDILINSLNNEYFIMTPLKSAISKNSLALFDMIIQHPSFVKDKDQLISCIRYALYQNKKDFLMKLFPLVKEFNIDINSPFLDGFCPLIKSLILTDINRDTIECILNSPDFDSKKSDIVKAFNISYDAKLFQSLTNSNFYLGQSFIFTNRMSLLYDFDCEHDHLINDLIQSKGQSFFTSLYVKAFEEKGFEVNKLYEFGYPLQYAIEKNLYIVFLCLINLNKADLNVPIKIVSRVRHGGAFANVRDNKTSYLHMIARLGRVKMLNEILTRNLIDVNLKNSTNETPLMEACRTGQKECIKMLFKMDNLDFLHRNELGEDALIMMNNIINSFDVEDSNENEINEITNKDEYLRELLRLADKLNEYNSNKIQLRKKTKPAVSVDDDQVFLLKIPSEPSNDNQHKQMFTIESLKSNQPSTTEDDSSNEDKAKKAKLHFTAKSNQPSTTEDDSSNENRLSNESTESPQTNSNTNEPTFPSNENQSATEKQQNESTKTHSEK